MVERVKYVCLRCGNVYESRAKTPQCPVCRSKRKMKFEEFLKLPKESQDKILGKVKRGNKGEHTVKKGEIPVGEGEDGVKYGEHTVKVGVKKGESPKITEGESEIPQNSPGEGVKKGDSPGFTRVKHGDDGGVKKGERVKGEKGKRGISIPKPRLGLKAYAVLGGLVFAYVMYHFGWFDEVFNSLKRLGAFAKSKPKEESNPLLERVNKNLSG